MPQQRKTLTAEVQPQSGAPLLLDMTGQAYITTASIGILALFVGSGGSGPYVYSLFSGSLPSGTTLDGATGQLTRTGTLVIGTYNFVIQVQDSASSVFQRAFTISVHSRLFVLEASPSQATVNGVYSYQFRVTGATGTLSYSIVSGTVNSGLSLSSTGLLSGTPNATGVVAPYTSYYFTVRATDSGSGESIDMAVAPFNVATEPVVEFIDAAPYPGTSLGGTFIPVVYIGTPYETKVKVTGGTPPFVFAGVSGAPSIADMGGTVDSSDGTLRFFVLQTPTAANGSGYSNATTVAIGVTDANNVSGTAATAGLVFAPRKRASSNNNAVVVEDAVDLNFLDGTNTTATVGGSAGESTVQINVAKGAGVTATSPIVVTSGNITHANSGVTAGSYDRVTVNATGHVTAGSTDFTTIFTRSIAASLQYNASDFSSMTTGTDVVRLTGTAGGASSFNEFYASGASGQTVFVVNASTTTITVVNNSAGGTAGSKYDIGANFTLSPGHGMILWKDGTSNTWRIVGAY